ncbi:MAG: YfhO family protein [Lachnospiraceae bacterium]|nr:YfhO family protein [Lachnospiraceae bacterium]
MIENSGNRDKKSFCINLLYYICAFGIPAVGMLVILFSRHFYPFGENTLLTGDMRAQYAEFYSSLRYVFGGNNSIFCSWARSWGGNYIGLFAYYLASPLSWIINLFPVDKIYAGILVLTVLKIGMSGLTFSIFAKSMYLHNNASRTGGFILLPLAVSYALMSYNIVYSQALMWLDGVIFLPLVVLGIEKLFSGRKGFLLIISLTASFVCNYYTGYMLALFAVLYLFFRLISTLQPIAPIHLDAPAASPTSAQISPVANKRILLRFICCTLLSAGLSAPLLLPAFLDLLTGKLTGYSVSAAESTGLTILEFLKQFTNGAYASLTYANVPYVYCGYATLCLAILFFVLRSISLSEKLCAIGMLIALFLGMYITKLNQIWHGFKLPNSYPFRDSFIFSFFILYLALRTLLSLMPALSDMPPRRFRIGIYACVFLLLIVSVDMGLNGRALLFHVEDEYDYDTVTDFANYTVTTEPLISKIKTSDDSFYRINQFYEYSKNDAMLWGYNGLAHYSSTYNKTVNDLTGKLGMSSDWLWNAGYGSTPLTDSLLSVKYVLARYALPEHYTLLSESGYGTASYLNPSTLPIAYTAPLLELSPSFNEDVFENQNRLLNAIVGEEINCFEPIDFVSLDSKNTFSEFSCERSYTFTAPSENPIYLMISSDEYTYTEIYANDSFVGNYFSSETTCCLYLGSFAPDEPVTVSVRMSADINASEPAIYTLNMKKMNFALSNLLKNAIQITSHHNGSLYGTLTIPKGQSIVTSIPYDSGWTVKIDNQKVPVTVFADTFLIIPSDALKDIAPGEHSISFTYLSPGVIPGLLIFLLSLCLILVHSRRRH